jgi:single stranded DNA-binding protein (ssb)
MWRKDAETAEKYIRKGCKLYIEGKLRYRTWEDRNTIKRTVTEIYVDYFEILGR